MRFFLLLLILALQSTPLPASTGPQCGFTFTDLFVRAPSPHLSDVELEILLMEFSLAPLVNELQFMHVRGYQEYEQGVRGIRHKTFNPFWVFRDPNALELLRMAYPFGYSIMRGNGMEYIGVEAILDLWAEAFQRAGGKIGGNWNSQARKEWLRRLYIELGIEHQIQQNVANRQPDHFSLDPDDDLSILPGIIPITNAFDNVENFQTQFRDEHRRRNNTRTPTGTRPDTPAFYQLRGQMEQMGLSTGGQPTPYRRQDSFMRRREEFLHIAANSILSSGNTVRPFAELFKLSPGDGAIQSLAGFLDVEELFKLFGKAEQFVNALSARLDWTFKREESTWAREIYLQVSLDYVANNGGFERFTHFQTKDPDEPYFLNTLDPLFKRTAWTVGEFETRFLQRCCQN